MPDESQQAEMRRFEIRISAADSNLRADQALTRHIDQLSRRQARRLALAGHLRCEGKKIAPSFRVQAGQVLLLEIPNQRPNDELISKVHVLRESSSFIYLEKPSRLHTVAITPDDPQALSTWISAHYPECKHASPDPREAGAIHRLDFETSGIVAFARSSEIWKQARTSFAQQRVEKHYLALCKSLKQSAPSWPPGFESHDSETGRHQTQKRWLTPNPSDLRRLEFNKCSTSPIGETICIDVPLRGSSDRRRVQTGETGTPARSLVQPVRLSTANPDHSGQAPHLLVQIHLITGHRHQIRAHLSWLDLPIVGDHLYAPATLQSDAGDLALHSSYLDLSHADPKEKPILSRPSFCSDE